MSSPDFAPVDFSLWDNVARTAWKDPAPHLKTHKTRVEAAWMNHDPNSARKVCAAFRRRLHAV